MKKNQRKGTLRLLVMDLFLDSLVIIPGQYFTIMKNQYLHVIKIVLKSILIFPKNLNMKGKTTQVEGLYLIRKK